MKVPKMEIAKISELIKYQPVNALVSNTDLVVAKHKKGISVLY